MIHTRSVTAQVVVLCDQCGRRRTSHVTRWAYGMDEDFLAGLVAAGWTVWAGRSRRVYCPDCEPRLGHKMHRVTLRADS